MPRWLSMERPSPQCEDGLEFKRPEETRLAAGGRAPHALGNDTRRQNRTDREKRSADRSLADLR